MMLKRLEVSGFKSFAKRSVLEFSAPITAIVGPNGSGKSNVVEAIRFVLGEQSMKSLRGKSGSDLIWKGSRLLPKTSRAMVTLVFDNTGRVFRLTNEDGTVIPLDFDEVSVSREVFSDGTGAYAVQGESVRLRDIHEMIAHLNIGASGHHIISQGEADRLLHARAPERKEMLEESLGLRLYHYRIKESERKLEKTEDHLREVESAHRELLPHIKFLKKQVEKIEKARELGQTLKQSFSNYRGALEVFLAREGERVRQDRASADAKVRELSALLDRSEDEKVHTSIEAHESEITKIRSTIREVRSEQEDIERQLGRIEGMLEIASEDTGQEATIAVSDVLSFLEALERELDEHARKATAPADLVSLYRIKRIAWAEQHPRSLASTASKMPDRRSLLATKESLEAKKVDFARVLDAHEATIQTILQTIHELRNATREHEREYYAYAEQKAQAVERVHQLDNEDAELKRMAAVLAEDVNEVEALIGEEIKPFSDGELRDRSWFQKERHEIERFKIRLEDLGGGGGGDVLKEYQDAEERQNFFEKEIADLVQAKTDLRTIIDDLREELEREFSNGITKVNAAFQEYFTLMFGGGHARIEPVTIEKRTRSDDDEVAELSDEEKETVDGIELDVSLPRKKVKDLDMLSGGERSLTSIALLFALSQVNPPPFLVLDETDAALDEANSRKYGDVLERLSEQTQLIVVTHNRETMSRAQILYGVTLGNDDASTLLSVKFEEAAKVAK